jgi:hypothetical protein
MSENISQIIAATKKPCFDVSLRPQPTVFATSADGSGAQGWIGLFDIDQMENMFAGYGTDVA